MKIQPITALKDNYIWVLTHSQSSHVAVVDPGDAIPVIHFLEQNKLTLAAILITHHHWDHTNGISALLARDQVPVYGSAKNKLTEINRSLIETEKLDLPQLNINFQVIEIPGHTLDHIAYYCSTEKILFCGDTLFTAGCGKVFEGSPAQMYKSLAKLKALPEDTKIYCGHEYTENNLHFAKLVEPDNKDIMTRIDNTQKLRQQNLPTVPAMLAEEKLTNPFLRCEIENVIHAAEQYSGRKLTEPAEVFEILRQWKNCLS